MEWGLGMGKLVVNPFLAAPVFLAVEVKGRGSNLSDRLCLLCSNTKSSYSSAQGFLAFSLSVVSFM